MYATDEVQKDLLDAEEIGVQKSTDFIENRIKSNNKDFYDTIPQNNLKSFTTMNATKKISIKGREVSIRADRDLFGRLMVIRERRGIQTKDLLQYSLGPIAWSLANTNGSIYKTDKSKLLHKLENDIPRLEEIPSSTARIYDGMCLIQQSPSGLETFGQLSDYVLKRISSNPSKVIFFITDQYWEISIKGGERDRR